MRAGIPLLLFLIAALACSGSDHLPTDVRPNFAVCNTMPSLTAVTPSVTQTANTSSSAFFTARNSCSTSPTPSYRLTAVRTGAVATVGTPSPSTISLDAGEAVRITVPYTTGAPGTGTVVLTETLVGGTSKKSVTMNVTVTQGTLGIPFGVTGITPTSNTDPRWTGGVRTNVSMAEVVRQLKAAQASTPRIRMFYNFVRGDEQVFFKSATDSSFDLQAWKDTLDNHARGAGFNPDGSSPWHDTLQKYSLIQDGTLQGAMLLDDAQNFKPDPTFAQAESLATHMKLRFPTVLTVMRLEPTVLKGWAGTSTYTKVDVSWAQYRQNKLGKDVTTYRNDEIAAAQALNLGLVLGMNITQGLPPFPPGSDISPETLLSWGKVLLENVASDYACGFNMYDINYDNINHENMDSLAVLAKNHVAAPCKRH